ncbi:MAG: CUAEP/CCAEP-tail radical SAM (seleno)protein [Vicinamibacterales bacterium]
MRTLLISTYDLGRQPLGLASPAAWLRRAGVEVDCADTSREEIDDGRIAAASLIGFYLPMHTATRLAGPLINRVRQVNPSARVCAYGLYASLNAPWLQERGVTDVLGPDAEQELVDLAQSRGPRAESPEPNAQSLEPKAQSLKPKAQSLPRLLFIQPDRTGLVPLERYASLRMPDGILRTIGSTDATRGCKHLCRHCPIVPIYRGRFRAVPLDVVLADVRAQVRAGAQHISFGDPDFLNGPTHARRVVEQLHREFKGLSYDVTIKIEHLLEHAGLIPVLRNTGCLFVTSAVESVDDAVLDTLQKGHTRGDFIRAVELCRREGLTLAPTFIPFTPWTTLEGYVELLDVIEGLDIVEQVAPVQLGIRLLVTAESELLGLPDIQRRVMPFDAASLTWPWRHDDPRVDDLQTTVMHMVKTTKEHTRSEAFSAIACVAREQAGMRATAARVTTRTPVPYVSEPWYCCAEPMENF